MLHCKEANKTTQALKTRLRVKLQVLTFARSLVRVLNKKPNDMFTACVSPPRVATRTYGSPECH